MEQSNNLKNKKLWIEYRPAVEGKKQDEYFDEIKKEISKFKKLLVKNNRKYQDNQ